MSASFRHGLDNFLSPSGLPFGTRPINEEEDQNHVLMEIVIILSQFHTALMLSFRSVLVALKVIALGD